MNDRPLPAGVELRLVGPADAGLFDRVHDDAFDERVRPDRVAAYLATPGHMMLVALHEGMVIAQVAAVFHRHPDKPSDLFIDEVGVAEPWRRQGLATAMLRQMLARGRELGAEEAWVGTEPDNVPARGLYERIGCPEAETFVLYEIGLVERD